MPTIGAPLQGYYYDQASDKLFPLAGMGTQGLQGLPGASMFCITFVGDATANITLTSMAAATDYFNGTSRYCTKADLLGYTQCRMIMRKMATAGAAGSSVQLGYSLTNPPNTYAGMSLAGVGSVLTGTNLTMDTGWVNMPTSMCANDMYVTPLQTGGDGSASPVVGGLWVFFRAPGTTALGAGVVGRAIGTGSLASITATPVDVPGLTIPITTLLGHWYRFTSRVSVMASGTTGTWETRLYEDGVVIDFADISPGVGGSQRQIIGIYLRQPTAGAHTYKVQVLTDISGASLPFASVQNNLVIEDIGV